VTSPDVSRTKCLVFDFDGVLVDSNHIKRNAYLTLFPAIPEGRALVESVIREDFDGDRYDTIRRILQRLSAAGLVAPDEFDEPAVTKYAERYGVLCEEAVVAAPEMPGCSQLLPVLAGRLPLYINSATPEEPLRRIIEKRGWAPFFKDALGRPRTKIENFRLILSREHLAPADLTFVGDSPHDQTAAAACGCAFVAVLGGFHRFLDAGPLAISHLSELSRLLGGDHASQS
jgi:phosphoglycolate phosphatase-like HAD superfamily hydrolase